MTNAEKVTESFKKLQKTIDIWAEEVVREPQNTIRLTNESFNNMREIF